MCTTRLILTANQVQTLLRFEPTKKLRDLQFKLESDLPRFKNKLSKDQQELIIDSIHNNLYKNGN